MAKGSSKNRNFEIFGFNFHSLTPLVCTSTIVPFCSPLAKANGNNPHPIRGPSVLYEYILIGLSPPGIYQFAHNAPWICWYFALSVSASVQYFTMTFFMKVKMVNSLILTLTCFNTYRFSIFKAN